MPKARNRNTSDLFRKHVLARAVLLGLTQQQLAYALSMDESTLSRTLRARHPQDRTVERISRGLDLTPEELFGEDDSPIVRPHPGISKDSLLDPEVQIREWLEGGNGS